MADLSTNVGGIRSPNPFWLASAPPTNSGYQVMRAFEAGWGGAVWKTLTDDPIVNVSSRFAGLSWKGQPMVGMNNIELISDRPLEDNLREIREVKQAFPDRAVVASLMIEPKRERWHEVVKRVQDAGVDGFELNFGCPHGMSERGMGAAVGQVPELVRQNTEWVVEVAEVPVIVKLTPNITDVRHTARAAVQGGAHAVSMINTINSLMGVDLDTWNPIPHVDGRGAHGGYCGPAVKPIALHMVGDCARDPEVTVPISGIGGVASWQDAVEFLLMGASNVQVCTAAMYYGFRIVEDMIDGLNQYLDARGIASVQEIVGQSVPRYGDWNDLNLSYKVVARIDQDKCIHCNRCYIACEDAAHQCIDRVQTAGRETQLVVDETECVGCNLCSMVCPVEDCITMVQVETGRPPQTWRERQLQA
ncbi:NAD-dependent dihydropyrimidine dehydrogenase subunit PreA [Alicyclobacillus cycloheptanicus]|uniref:dihydrouracil dehydrogenase (NAD(+)) n=1 Tax=Alicyclobacillus cycloheptanicus TaxID=1457 RepID=A0ABT9XEF8_9BACL|nr:NAD-dependent dihydropyrimidine dehydrogenase subunit PreA [Alicyclobacillus cycloheptanicus]MDQ0188679.1 dihydropyrimidine dehydrogenase (NAD+) subunit PreA [Alicyclobacillus cycloheptanicus]WDM00649.1 NAD-dependent dihydropyrimidine dehydrogenase subunit PreA [Alicyclobacillus cycloheptanicus]